MSEFFRTLSQYNRWANERLHQDLAGIPDADLNAPLKVNFGSVMGVLNHLLLGDRLWLSRFTGQGEPPKDIAAVPHPDMSSFLSARQAEDQRIIAFADSLSGQSAEFLGQTLKYHNIAGKPCSGVYAELVHHFFNHQTHHRGQVHGLAGRFGASPRDIDLVYFLQERAQAA